MEPSLRAIDKMVHELSPPAQAEVRDFIEFLLRKGEKRKPTKLKTKLKQNWAGSLKQFKKKFTSLELQKKALEWRNT
jgi:Protein of unknown function (DUF2281)